MKSLSIFSQYGSLHKLLKIRICETIYHSYVPKMGAVRCDHPIRTLYVTSMVSYICVMKIDKRTFSIEELADLAGTTRRAVRFYVQSGLLPPPEGTARGAYYTQAHLQKMLNIRAWQDEGLTLEGIRNRFAANTDSPELRPRSPIEVWTRLNLADGVELHLNPEVSGLNTDAVRRLAADIGKLVLAIKKEKSE